MPQKSPKLEGEHYQNPAKFIWSNVDIFGSSFKLSYPNFQNPQHCSQVFILTSEYPPYRVFFSSHCEKITKNGHGRDANEGLIVKYIHCGV